MIAEKLKQETLTNHQQLEKMLVGRMKAIRSKEDYIGLLQLFYTYFGGLEKLIDQHINTDELPDYADRRKSTALATDITELGGKPEEIAGETYLPSIQNINQAYAAMYVIEGSTLGGKIISKMMAQQLNISDGNGLSFFNGYGNNTETMWHTFREKLNTKAQNAAQEAEIIDTANQTFALFKAWAEKESV